jgi:hypothetical protein
VQETCQQRRLESKHLPSNTLICSPRGWSIISNAERETNDNYNNNKNIAIVTISISFVHPRFSR